MLLEKLKGKPTAFMFSAICMTCGSENLVMNEGLGTYSVWSGKCKEDDDDLVDAWKLEQHLLVTSYTIIAIYHQFTLR